jgi:hypothetical protein
LAERENRTELMYKRISLLETHLASLELKATENRDQLYALLSFARETTTTHEIQRLLLSDYIKTNERGFADFTIWCILESRSLSAVSANYTQRGRTWVRMISDIERHREKPSTVLWAFSMASAYPRRAI